ncbi:MAG: hypothetical protein AAF591_20610, partial [Verrucomicrobiota bacterium]
IFRLVQRVRHHIDRKAASFRDAEYSEKISRLDEILTEHNREIESIENSLRMEEEIREAAKKSAEEDFRKLFNSAVKSVVERYRNPDNASNQGPIQLYSHALQVDKINDLYAEKTSDFVTMDARKNSPIRASKWLLLFAFCLSGVIKAGDIKCIAQQNAWFNYSDETKHLCFPPTNESPVEAGEAMLFSDVNNMLKEYTENVHRMNSGLVDNVIASMAQRNENISISLDKAESSASPIFNVNTQVTVSEDEAVKRTYAVQLSKGQDLFMFPGFIAGSTEMTPALKESIPQIFNGLNGCEGDKQIKVVGYADRKPHTLESKSNNIDLANNRAQVVFNQLSTLKNGVGDVGQHGWSIVKHVWRLSEYDEMMDVAGFFDDENDLGDADIGVFNRRVDILVSMDSECRDPQYRKVIFNTSESKV